VRSAVAVCHRPRCGLGECDSGLSRPLGCQAEAHSLTGTGDARLTPEAVNVVLRMTHAGFAAQEIVDRLNNPRITHRTVNYLRQRYQQSPPDEVVTTRTLVSLAQRKAG